MPKNGGFKYNSFYYIYIFDRFDLLKIYYRKKLLKGYLVIRFISKSVTKIWLLLLYNLFIFK